MLHPNVIKKLKSLKTPQFEKAEVLVRIKKYLDNLVIFDSINEAYDLAQSLTLFLDKDRPNFKNDYPQIYKEYQEIIKKAKWVAFPFLKEEEIIDMFEKDLMNIFSLEEYDLWYKLEGKLVRIFLHENRDKFKRKLREALFRNEEIITTKELKIENETLAPTISHWFKEYNRVLGTARVDKIKQAQFLVDNHNIQNTSPEEKEKLRQLFSVYEKLKLSSLTPEGLEESVSVEVDGQRKVLTKGKFTEASDPVGLKYLEAVRRVLREEGLTEKAREDEKLTLEFLTSQIPDLAIQEKYQGDPEEERAIFEELAEIKKTTQNDFIKVSHEFYQALNIPLGRKPDKIRIIALFYLLAERDEFSAFLKDDRFSSLIENYLKRENEAELLKDFKIHPTALQFLKILLKYILEERLDLEESEAARIAMHLANKTKGDKYKKLSYFDLESKEFKWN